MGPLQRVLLIVLLATASACSSRTGNAQVASVDLLPSWNDTNAKKSIIDFVQKVTKSGPDFVPVPERIATIDNDGTLWTEQPIYPQYQFALDQVKSLAPQHPEWKQQQPFKAILEGSSKELVASGAAGEAKVMSITHAGMTTGEFQNTVTKWIGSAQHPRFHRLYTELVYQPMLELLAYLRANGFKTYIVSGGGVEFIRAWSERVYGIPPEQVIGTMSKLKYEEVDGKPVLRKDSEVLWVDDKSGKPVSIEEIIGRRPIFAAGNSDGDLEMLEWTTSGSGPRFGMLVRHTDSEREYAYDRDSPVGKLDRALDRAAMVGWLVVETRNDWKVIYPIGP
jgi:phosphoserine phosphatase